MRDGHRPATVLPPAAPQKVSRATGPPHTKVIALGTIVTFMNGDQAETMKAADKDKRPPERRTARGRARQDIVHVDYTPKSTTAR